MASVPLAMATPFRRHIQDLNHRVWLLQNQILTAVPRKEQVVPAIVTMIPCKHLDTLEKDRGMPTYLGLQEPTRSLFCKKDEETPVLQLKEKYIMDLHNQPEPVKPFLFYHNEIGRISTFESVAFPGWFIAVGPTGECPLLMTQQRGQAYVTEFEVFGLSDMLLCGVVSTPFGS